MDISTIIRKISLVLTISFVFVIYSYAQTAVTNSTMATKKSTAMKQEVGVPSPQNDATELAPGENHTRLFHKNHDGTLTEVPLTNNTTLTERPAKKFQPAPAGAKQDATNNIKR